MRIDLSNKTILVTGANSGIGNAIAQELLNAGAKVALHFNSNSDGASKLKEQFSDQCELFQADFNNVDETIKLFADVLSWGDTLDVLINNAGINENILLLTLLLNFKLIIFNSLN